MKEQGHQLGFTPPVSLVVEFVDEQVSDLGTECRWTSSKGALFRSDRL